MNEPLHCMRGMDLSGLAPPEAREELLNRLEGLLHHLMSDVMDALALLTAVKEVDGLWKSKNETCESQNPLVCETKQKREYFTWARDEHP